MTGGTVLVTGADGFVGSVLVERLRAEGASVRPVVRRTGLASVAGSIAVGDIMDFSGWPSLLSGVDVVVHLAGVAHDVSGRATEADYRRVNVTATRLLAQACAAEGVRHFVFVSTLKVLGESSGDMPFFSGSPLRPSDAYSRSKAEAEEVLAEIFAGRATCLSVVRPPLVYGPGVKANFLRMMEAVRHGIPLPLGRVENRRSLVSIWNLCDLFLVITLTPDPRPGTWLVSDGEDLSTPDLLKRLGVAMGRPANVLPVPLPILSGAAVLVRKKAEFERLVTSLYVDISDTQDRLGWSPSVSVDTSLARTASWYLRTCGATDR